MRGNEAGPRSGEQTAGQESVNKKIWRRPEVISGAVDETETGILIGPEAIVSLS